MRKYTVQTMDGAALRSPTDSEALSFFAVFVFRNQMLWITNLTETQDAAFSGGHVNQNVDTPWSIPEFDWYQNSQMSRLRSMCKIICFTLSKEPLVCLLLVS